MLAVGLLALPAAADDKPLTPVEARKQVGKEVTVTMEVKAAKDRLEKRGEIYLDAKEDFKDDKNFAVVITKAGAESLKVAGIADPAEHFRGKTIRARGDGEGGGRGAASGDRRRQAHRGRSRLERCRRGCPGSARSVCCR